MALQHLTLEDQINASFHDLQVAEAHRASVWNFLGVLREKDQPTYEHSIRVGLLGSRIATRMLLDPKALLFPGTLHDFGKTLVPREILQKTEGFTEQDMRKMRKHPMYGYLILREIHPFSAEVLLRHHRHQENGYPKKLPKPLVKFSDNTLLMIDFYSRLLALSDFYDALTTRANEKFGGRKNLDENEAKSILLAKNPDLKYTIGQLYKNGILGSGVGSVDSPERQLRLYDSLWDGWEARRNPRDTRRAVILACAMEPFSEKAGCTTRSLDISPHLKLEYLVAGAINIGDAFEDLARRVAESGSQPSLIYDLAHKAQADCKKNRAGGRINLGIIEMLTPIVAAQTIFDPTYSLPIDEVLDKAKEVLQHTSSQDVQELVAMKKLAGELCEYYGRVVQEHPEAKDVFSYYSADLQSSEKPTSKKHNEEFILGFLSIREMYHTIMASSRRTLNGRVEEAYSRLRVGSHRDVSPGLTADCAACAIYLVLSHHPKDELII